jgi:ABC-type phosphate transport system substrate-binding protein
MMNNGTRLQQIVALSMLVCAPVTLRSGDSGAGAAAVMEGEAEIGMVSRALSTKEQSRLKHEVIGYGAQSDTQQP